MRKEMSLFLVIIVFALIVFVIFFLYKMGDPKDFPTEEEIINNCKNKDVIKTANCLRDNVKIFYKYEITDDSLNLTLKELQEQGGDCRNYAFLYSDLGKKLGFETTTRAYSGKNDIFPGHRFAVIWDDKNYCKLDLLKVNCFETMKERGEIK